jgi:hypothetical protein
MIAGEIITFKRHTRSIEDNLREIISLAFEEITPRFNQLKQETLFLQEKLIRRKAAMELISDLFFNQQALSVTQLSLLKEKLYTDPNFSLPQDPETYFPAWYLYNQVTEVMKHGSPGGYFQQHIEMHHYFRKVLNDA